MSKSRRMRTDYSVSWEVRACEKDPLRSLSMSYLYTRCRVGSTTCSMMIDRDASMNLVSQTLVEGLKLPMTPHPEPYNLWWNEKKVKIKHRVKLQFTLCGHTDF